MSSTSRPLDASSTSGAEKTAVASRASSSRPVAAWKAMLAPVLKTPATRAATSAPQRNAVTR